MSRCYSVRFAARSNKACCGLREIYILLNIIIRWPDWLDPGIVL